MPSTRSMSREQAIEHLAQCSGCHRWITTPDCDHCWVDRHRCPPTIAKAKATLQETIELGERAKKLMAKLRAIEV